MARSGDSCSGKEMGEIYEDEMNLMELLFCSLKV